MCNFICLFYQRETYLTGGGTPKTNKSNPLYERTLALIKPTITPMVNEFDSGAPYNTVEGIEIEYLDDEMNLSATEFLSNEPVAGPSKNRDRSPISTSDSPVIDLTPVKTQDQFKDTQSSSGRQSCLKSVYKNMEKITASKVEKKRSDGVFSEKMLEFKREEHIMEMQILDERLKTEKLKRELKMLEI